jgi:hypothetical protein
MESHIEILGVPFRVVTADAACLPEGHRGLCDHAHATITIAEGMPPGITRQTLVHEILHAVADSVGIDLTEGQVQTLAAGLSSIPQLAVNV